MENKVGERSIAWNVLALLSWCRVVACLWVDGKRRPRDSCKLHYIDACIDFTILQVALEKSLTPATLKIILLLVVAKAAQVAQKILLDVRVAFQREQPLPARELSLQSLIGPTWNRSK